MGRTMLFAAALFVAAFALGVHASDPELTTDFFIPPNMTAANIDGNFFTSDLLKNVKPAAGGFATVTPANSVNGFTALTGLGVSAALIQFPPGTVNAVHTHPRGTELLYLIEGTLDVGLLDTTSPVPNLFTKKLQTGDLFVFPKGLVHFQINNDKYTTAKAVVGFSSSNPGLVRLPATLFGTMISDEVLKKSFEVSDDVIAKLKAAQAKA